jgi:Dehydrogenases (flavoproteins)
MARARRHPVISRRGTRRFPVRRNEAGRRTGGGPAGAFTAERLAAAGFDTILVDEKLAWEKPCGGGLTYKAYSQYPFLIDNPRRKSWSPIRGWPPPPAVRSGCT